jgi:hypothetical protein
MKKTCVKKCYSEKEVREEVIKLKEEVPECRWWYKFCLEHNAFHVCREGSTYVLGT